MTIRQIRKLLNSSGLLIVAQIRLSEDDVINLPMTKRQVYDKIKDFPASTETCWIHVEEHNLLVIG